MAPETQCVSIQWRIEGDLPQHWLQKWGLILGLQVCENDIQIDPEVKDKHLVYNLVIVISAEEEACKADHKCVAIQPQNQKVSWWMIVEEI